MKRLILIPFLFVAFFVQAQSGSVRAIDQPKFQILGNLHTILFSAGLKTNTTNEYGTVEADGNVTAMYSLLPGPTGRNFTTAGVTNARIQRIMVNGIPVLDMTGNRWLRSTSSAATYDAFSHNAVFANLKWSITMLVRMGYGASPGHLNSLIGNNGSSAGQKGFFIATNDFNTATNTVSHAISKGTAGFISVSGDNSIFVPNEWEIWTFTFDGSLSAANRFKAYKYKTAQTLAVTSASTATVTTPTNVLEIFNVGGGLVNGGGIGQLVMCVMQTGVENQTIREEFIDSITPLKDALNNFSNEVAHPYNYVKDAGTDYYLTALVCQDPTNPNTIVKFYRKGPGGHITDTNTFIYKQKSTDRGLTWSAETLWYDPGGVLGIGDLGGGYTSTGKLLIFTDVRTTNGVDMEPFSAILLSSTDDADTAPTVTDLTSIVPADGLNLFTMHDQLVQTSTGRLLFGFYKYESDFSQSANYKFFSDDDGATWGIKTVRAPGSAFMNESATVVVSNGGTERIISYIRREDTKEWHGFSSTNDANSFSDEGAVTLGEAFTSAIPGRFSKFSLYGVGVVAYWYVDRGVSPPEFKVIFVKESTLVSSPTTFDEETKTILRYRQLQYGTMIHPYGDLYSIGSYDEEPVVPTLNESRNITLFGGTFTKDLVLRELNITKQ